MKLQAVILLHLFLAGVVLGEGPKVGYSCFTQLPVGRKASEVERTESVSVPFVIQTTPKTGFVYGQDITVEILAKPSSGMSFNSFILQAQVPSRITQFGTFDSDHPGVKLYSCSGQADTVVNAGRADITRVSATWTPPRDMDKQTMIEFDATVSTMDGRFWKVRSILIRFDSPPSEPDTGDFPRDPHTGETAVEDRLPDDFEQPHTGNEGDVELDGTGEDPNEGERIAEQEAQESLLRDQEGEALDDAEEADDHGLLAEEESTQRRRAWHDHLLEEEIQAGESDYVIEMKREEERHQKEMDDERAESERAKAEERRQREEQIQAELRDLEEWEADRTADDDSEETERETEEETERETEEETERETEEETEEELATDDDDVLDGRGGSAVLRPLWMSAVVAVILAALF